MTLRLLPCLIPLAVLIGCADGVGPEIDFGAGIGGLDLEDEGGFESVIDGPRASGRFAVSGSGTVAVTDDFGSGPRIGGRVGFSYARRDLGGSRVAGEPLLTVDDFVDLLIVSPQVTASYRQYLGGADYFGEGWFVEPGLGLGPTFGYLSFGSQLEFADDVLSSDVEETEDAFGLGVEPYARLGYAGDGFVGGVEGGYLYTTLNFDDDLGQDANQWYIGFFVGVRLGN